MFPVIEALTAAQNAFHFDCCHQCFAFLYDDMMWNWSLGFVLLEAFVLWVPSLVPPHGVVVPSLLFRVLLLFLLGLDLVQEVEKHLEHGLEDHHSQGRLLVDASLLDFLLPLLRHGEQDFQQ